MERLPRAPYLRLAIAMLRRRRLIVVSGLAVGVTVVVFGLLAPRSYTADSVFFPRSRRQPASLSGLASQLGLALPGSDATESPAFFEQLLRSRPVLDSLLSSRFVYQADTGQVDGTLLTIYRIEGDSAIRALHGRKLLLASIGTAIDPKSGTIQLAVLAPHPTLTALMNQRLLDLIDQFNRETRQSQASAERRFTERRLAEVRAELRQAEDEMQSFLSRNREFRSSAQLSFQQERLARELSLRQQVYTTLAQSYEQARIEEVRDTPVLTVVQTPRPPELPNGRGLAVKGLLGAILGGLLAMIGVVIGLNFRLFQSRDPVRYAELVTLRAEAVADLRRPWRLLGMRR